MLKKWTNVFSEEQLNALRQTVCGNPVLMAHVDNTYVSNSIDGHIPAVDVAVPLIEDLVRKELDFDIKFENSYCRTYHKGAQMTVHTDRPGLDVTVSLCIDKKVSEPYPLCVSTIEYDLSPENLTCDGELSRAQVQARYRSLTTVAQQLQQLDPSVSFYEL